MRFPDSFLDEIRDRLPISQVIGQRVQFDKKKSIPAKGDHWACCPFHGEKTPSFHCEDRKGRYYCFGCGASGDHFRFITELDGVNFAEAVERLAAQAGLQMPIMNPREQEREEKRKTLFDVMEMAAKYFQTQLQEAGGASARAYLRDRGLSAAIQQEFGVGFAPDSRNALKQFLAENGVTPQQMEACGLVNHGEGIAVSYDKFRDRIMFPIPDSRGRIIAFGGRAMKADALAKYMNSPETELFHKSNVLFNFAKARKSAYDRKQIIAAEGYMDVIALHSAGFQNAVAPLGTALTERQMELLWRLDSEPILCFDGDGAGVKAAHRAIDMVLPLIQPGRSVKFAMLPDGQDPDDLIREEGPEAMGQVIENALPLAEMVWNREISIGTHDTPERRAEFEARLRNIVGSIRDQNVRRHYGQDIAARLTSHFAGPQQAEPQQRRPYQQKSRHYSQSGQGYRKNASRNFSASPSLLGSKLMKEGGSTIPLREAAIIGGLVFHPALGLEFFDQVSALSVKNKDAIALHSIFLDCFANWTGEGDYPDREFVKKALIGAGLETTLGQLEDQLTRAQLWQSLPQAAYEDAKDGWLQAYTLQVKNQTLNMELKAAERALAEEDSQENLERLLHIQQELSRSDGVEALIDGFGVPSGRPQRGF